MPPPFLPFCGGSVENKLMSAKVRDLRNSGELFIIAAARKKMKALSNILWRGDSREKNVRDPPDVPADGFNILLISISASFDVPRLPNPWKAS